MGMDVFGKNPTSETGKYFRNNVWWWRPLWDYCCEVGSSVIDASTRKGGHYNDGAGLSAEKSKKLAALLKEEIVSGRTAERAVHHASELAGMEDEPCSLCGGTGKRTDMEVRNGCNSCSGSGKVRPSETNYPFDATNVAEFAAFLEDCGGFRID